MGVAYNPRIVTNGLVLALDAGNAKSYPGSGTTWTDLSGSTVVGTLINGVTYNANNGGTMVFDGQNDYITTNTIASTTSNTAFSIEVIFKSSNNTNNPIMLCPQNNGIDHFLRIYSNNNFGFQLTTSADVGNRAYSASGFDLNTYYHAVCVKDENNIYIYKNGSLATTAADTLGTGNWGNTTWAIGNRGNDTFWFTGEIPVIKFYNKVLTAAEVKQNFNAMRGRYGI
jgi:hypothetical protein